MITINIYANSFDSMLFVIRYFYHLTESTETGELDSILIDLLINIYKCFHF